MRAYCDLVCPFCQGVLLEVNDSGRRRWFCPVAIGEEGIDSDTKRIVMDEGSLHREVTVWRETDRVIREQLDDYKTYVKVPRKRAA